MRRILTAFALLACASSAQAMTYAEAGWFIENGLPLNVLYELAMIDCGGKGDLTACDIAEMIARERPEAVPAPQPRVTLRGVQRVLRMTGDTMVQTQERANEAARQASPMMEQQWCRLAQHRVQQGHRPAYVPMGCPLP